MCSGNSQERSGAVSSLTVREIMVAVGVDFDEPDVITNLCIFL
jgi:hypothetical protein